MVCHFRVCILCPRKSCILLSADDAENPEEVTENGAKDSPPPPAPDSAPTAATNDASDTSPTIGASLLHSSSTIADTSSSTPAATSSTPSSTPVASSANADASRDSSPRIDNRNLCDRDENQRLGRDDIEELRAQGKRGHEIIGHLVNNSLTFKARLVYEGITDQLTVQLKIEAGYATFCHI